MIDTHVELDGKRVKLKDLGRALEHKAIEAKVRELQQKLSGIRDPVTGKHPTIAVRKIDDNSYHIEIEGTKKAVALANQVLGIDAEADQPSDQLATLKSPRVFLCHATEDKATVLKLAHDFHENGIDTFYSEWEITDEDSIVQKINQGLGDCSHFLVLISPVSLTKPWVQAEMDAGFIRKVEGECKFIVVRLGIKPEELPPLLRPRFSRDISDYESASKQLINTILGISKKPAVKARPAYIDDAKQSDAGLSPGAFVLAKYLVDKSEHGESMDPTCEPETLIADLPLSTDEIVDAVDELKSRGLAKTHPSIMSSVQGLDPVSTTASLFSELDGHFCEWSPTEDALRIAAYLVNEKESANTQKLADEFGWPSRRMNPALSYLIDRDLVLHSKAINWPWRTSSIHKTNKTRRFLQEAD